MEVTIVWTKQAEKGLINTIKYLEKEWTAKEILRLEQNIQAFIERIKLQPELYPKTSKYKYLHKGMVDGHNYIVYKTSYKDKRITIVNFRASKQRPIY